MKYVITNQIGHKKVNRIFMEAEEANNYIHKVCKYNCFTTASVEKLANNEIYITIWDTMY